MDLGLGLAYVHEHAVLTWKEMQIATHSGPSGWNVPQGIRFDTWSSFLRVSCVPTPPGKRLNSLQAVYIIL